MRNWSANRGVREASGAMASAAVTVVVFGAGPVLALLWWLGGGAAIEVMPPPAAFEAEPVVLAWSALAEDLDEDGTGEGGTEEGERMAGPDPTEGSGGDGSSDALVDASGDEGEDDQTESGSAVEGEVESGRSVSARRLARGMRVPGARGYSDAANSLRRGIRRRKGGRRCPTSHPDVSTAGTDQWTVNRNLVSWYTKSFKRFNSLGWSGPYRNDTYKGWKIGGFGCTSPLHHAGFRRGDIVLTVNDRPTRTWLQIFGMYAKLKLKKEFEVVLIRRGKRKVLRYTLVDGGPPTTG